MLSRKFSDLVARVVAVWPSALTLKGRQIIWKHQAKEHRSRCTVLDVGCCRPPFGKWLLRLSARRERGNIAAR